LHEAEQHRNKLLFNPPQETGNRKFALFAPASSIQKKSSGLGLYFCTLEYLLIIVGAACLLAIYPIYSNLRADKPAERYTLIIQGASSTASCPKGYDVRF
jgi:hypothetical protein